MGNILTTQNTKDYDIVFHIEKLMDVDLGWPITFPNQQLRELYQPSENGNENLKHTLKKNFKWDSLIASIQGKHKSGKTFLLNILGNTEISSSTKGLSVKIVNLPPPYQRNLAFMETSGMMNPIFPLPLKETELLIEETKSTENFLRDLTISSSDLNILITDEFSQVDWELLMKMSKMLALKIKKEQELKKTQKKENIPTKTRPEILVVHNFKDLSYEEALFKWKNIVNEMNRHSSILLSSHNNNEQEDLLPTKKTSKEDVISISNNNNNNNNKDDIDVNVDEKEDVNEKEEKKEGGEREVERMEVREVVEGEEILFTHLFLCKHLHPNDISYNLLVSDQIKNWICSGPPQKEMMINPLAYISTMSEMNLPNYITGMNKMGMYYLSDPLSLFYLYQHNHTSMCPTHLHSKLQEEAMLRENCGKFQLDFEKDLSSHLSLLELKNIMKWSVNQCEQLREWMLVSKEKRVNGIPLEFFSRVYGMQWEEYVENMWKRDIDTVTLYALAQVMKYKVVIMTSSVCHPVFVFTSENSFLVKDTIYFSFSRYGNIFSRLLPKSDSAGERESKIKKNSSFGVLTFRCCENSLEKKIFGRSILKSSIVSSCLSSSFDFSQNFPVKYSSEINKRDQSLRIIIDVPYSFNDHLEYSCPLLKDPLRYKLEVRGRREVDDDWVISETTRKFGEWSFNYEIPKEYTLEEPNVEYKDGSLIFTFKYGVHRTSFKKIFKSK